MRRKGELFNIDSRGILESVNPEKRVLTQVQHGGGTHLPKVVRDWLGVKEGDYISWTLPETGCVRIRKAKITE